MTLAQAHSNVTGFRCVLCDRGLDADFRGYTCPDCGDEGILDVEYDYDRARVELTADGLAVNSRRDIWRYGAPPVLPGGGNDDDEPRSCGCNRSPVAPAFLFMLVIAALAWAVRRDAG